MGKKTAIITGISGTLGSAFGRAYIERGWRVVGVSRQQNIEGRGLNFTELCTNNQDTAEDARELMGYDPDLIILNAGQIETDVGPNGEPLVESVESINRINYLFPALAALEAAKTNPKKPLDIICIGSIADGSPSAFGPVYHASKIALNYYVAGVSPILYSANPNVRLRYYRPGVIKGPLSWAPVNRLNERGYKIRAKRCEGAPEADVVAARIIRWIDSEKWVGSYDEPFSFRFFKYLYKLVPNFYHKMQVIGWRKGSRFGRAEGGGKG